MKTGQAITIRVVDRHGQDYVVQGTITRAAADHILVKSDTGSMHVFVLRRLVNNVYR